MNKASCLCKRVTFEVKRFEPQVAHCHCSMCRKFHGAAFSTFGEVKKANLIWLTGQEDLAEYRAENDTVRSFCQHCGSSLLFESQYNRQAGTIEVALAVFDQLDVIKPNAHIYTSSQVPWITLNDELPVYLHYRE
ncbi:GFA family protein [Thalassotalea ganghwensis]